MFKKLQIKKDTIFDFLFWSFLFIFIIAGVFQIRYQLGSIFGWRYNSETATNELYGVGHLAEFVVAFIGLVVISIVYGLWQEKDK